MKKKYAILISVLCVLQASAQNVIGEEKYNDYRLERYSDGTSKIFDKNNNWIHFYTEYRENEYTGESTIPYELQSYLPKTKGFSDYGAIFGPKGDCPWRTDAAA